MATVRMADKRVDDIVSKARKKYEEVNKPMEFDTTMTDNLFTEAYASKLQSYYLWMEEHFPEIPVTKTSIDAVKLTYLEPSDQEDEEDAIYDRSKDCDLSTSQMVPSTFTDRYGTFTIQVELDNPCLQHAIQVNNFNNDLRDKAWEYEREVRDLCYQFKTLNQALKHMPALEKLCDPDDIARVHEKVDRNKAEEIMQDVVDDKGQQLKEVLLESSLLGDDNV